MSGRARRIWLAVVFGLPVGCTSLPEPGPAPPRTARPAAPPASSSAVRPVSFTQDAIASQPFAGLTELTAEAVVAQGLARHPTLAQMVAGHQAAAGRDPPVPARDDP